MFVLSIIGTILLWILFVFLGLLALLLLIMLVIWVSPIKYHADISLAKNGGGKLETNVQAKGRWLYGLVRFKVDGEDVRVKLLFFTIIRKKAEELNTDKTPNSETKQELKEQMQEAKNKTKINEQETKSNVIPPKEEMKKEASAKKEGFFTRLKKKFTQFKDMYTAIMHHPDRREIQRLLWAYVKKMLKRFKPRVFKVSGIIGFDSPDKTGMAIGAVCAVRGMTNFNILIDGDFDNEVISLNVHIKDKLRLCQIAYPTLRLVLGKKIRPHVFGLLRK